MEIRFLVNADDLGLSAGVNYGIQEAYRKGIVRSTSLLSTGESFAHAVSIAHHNTGLEVGVHLTLTHGGPVGSKPDTLVDKDGRFLTRGQLVAHCDSLDPHQVQREFEAQIQKVLDHGIRPTHLNSHHYIHLLEPIFPIFLRLARAYCLPVRVREQIPPPYSELVYPKMLVDSFRGAGATTRHFLEILDLHKDGDESVEVVTHPGYVDKVLYRNSTYSLFRAQELRVLLSEDVKQCIERNDISLIGYQQLA